MLSIRHALAFGDFCAFLYLFRAPYLSGYAGPLIALLLCAGDGGRVASEWAGQYRALSLNGVACP